MENRTLKLKPVTQMLTPQYVAKHKTSISRKEKKNHGQHMLSFITAFMCIQNNIFNQLITCDLFT